MAIYLESSELKDSYLEAEKAHAEWIKPFNEYERLAGNKISKTIGKNMPRVNDGSLAASLLETPMNVLPSMQVGKFKSTNRKTAWLDEIANIIFTTRILPNANTQASFFDKEQISLYRALKYGAQPRYNFFVSNETYTGSDWSLPYIKNLKLEPGKFSVDDCDYVFLDIYYTKLQLKKIIDQVKQEKKLAKEEGRKPDNSWNVDNLQKLADMALTQKEMEDLNSSERDKQANASGIKTTVCFQRGIQAPFTMFSKHLGDGETLRDWTNPDPTGDLPITMQYCYETLESPYGIGRVELAGPTQNVLDFMTQAHVLATQLGLQSPIKISGPVDTANLNTFVNAPNAKWITGSAQVDIVNTTSAVYSRFGDSIGLYKSQLQTLQGRTDVTFSATSGNPEFSKTSAGVNMQEDRTNAQDNYLKQKAMTASEKMIQKMMNVHMAQMKGADILDVAKEDIERLRKAGYFDDNPDTPEPTEGDLAVTYDELKDTFKFEYDAAPESNDEEKNRWIELIDIVTSNPNILPALQASGWQFDLGEAIKRVISASGADGWEKVLIQLDPEREAQVDPLTGQPVMNPEEMGGPGEMASPQPLQAPGQGQDELTTIMDTYQVDEPTAQAVQAARAQGFDEAEIIDFLQSNGGQ